MTLAQYGSCTFWCMSRLSARLLYLGLVLFLCLLPLISMKGLVQPNRIQEGSESAIDDILANAKRAEHYLNLNPDSAFFYAKKALDLSELRSYEKGLGLSKKVIGEIFYLQGAYDLSIQYLLESSAHFEVIDDKEGLADNHIALGIANQYALRLEPSLEYFRRGLVQFRELKLTTGVANAYGNLGHYFEKAGVYDSAFYYQNKALSLYESVDDKAGMAIIYDNLGSIHEDLEQYDEAFRYFMLSARYDSISENKAALVISLNNIGDSYRKREQYEAGLVYTHRALDLANALGLSYQTRSAYRDLAKNYSITGRMDLAFAYMDSIYDLNERIFSTQTAGQIANLQTLYGMKQKEQEIALLESQRRVAQNTRNSIIIGALGLIGFAGILIVQQRNRSKKDKQFFAAEKALDKEKLKNIQLKEKALEAELENKQLKEEQLHQELESRSQELTTKALHIIQKNKLLKDLRSEIKDIHRDAKTKGQQKALKKVTGLIDSGFRFDKDWDEFVTVFDQVHTDFFDRLKTHCPNLTAAELRLCSLIRLNLNSKDMAMILAISQDSLRISRYRLRKKLGLEKGDNLTNHIIRL